MANPAAGCRNAHSPVRPLIPARWRPLRRVWSSSLGVAVNPPTYSIGETFCLRGGEVHRLTALFNSIAYWRRATMTAGYVAILCAALIAGASARPDESSSDSVGVIDGEAISVTGPMSVEVVHGRVKTVLRSGSEVRVKSGTARIDLVEGGQIGICGPAHLSVLKSGGSLTVALDTGTIHVHIEQDLALTIYTPRFRRKPSPSATRREMSSSGSMPPAPCASARIAAPSERSSSSPGRAFSFRRLATCSSSTGSLTAFVSDAHGAG